MNFKLIHSTNKRTTKKTYESFFAFYCDSIFRLLKNWMYSEDVSNDFWIFITSVTFGRNNAINPSVRGYSLKY